MITVGTLVRAIEPNQVSNLRMLGEGDLWVCLEDSRTKANLRHYKSLTTGNTYYWYDREVEVPDE